MFLNNLATIISKKGTPQYMTSLRRPEHRKNPF